MTRRCPSLFGLALPAVELGCARDFFNLQGAKDILAPIHAQEVLGIIHQTPEPLQNDSIVTILRGHGFIPLYVNPKHMDPRRWRFLASLCTWTRKNADLLSHTKALCFGGWADEKRSRTWEAALPRDVYGYAHFAGDAGLVMLRNPWVRPTRVGIKLDRSVGATESLRDASVTCLYPRYGRLPGAVSHGSRLDVELGPYETRLLALGGYDDAPALPADPCPLAVRGIEWAIAQDHQKASFAFEAVGGMPGRQLWVLSESPAPFEAPVCTIAADGRAVESKTCESTTGWHASGHAPHEYWHWHIAELPPQDTKVEVSLLAQDNANVSAWLVATGPVPDDPATSGPIPPPEVRWLDAAEVLAPVPLRWIDQTGPANIALASEGATVTASSVWAAEFGPGQTIDGRRDTRWNSAGGDVAGAWLAVDFGRPRKISSICFHEAAGGRIQEYKLQRWDKDEWRDIVTAKKMPAKTTVRHRFDPVETGRIRLLVVSATEVPSIFDIEAR